MTDAQSSIQRTPPKSIHQPIPSWAVPRIASSFLRSPGWRVLGRVWPGVQQLEYLHAERFLAFDGETGGLYVADSVPVYVFAPHPDREGGEPVHDLSQDAIARPHMLAQQEPPLGGGDAQPLAE